MYIKINFGNKIRTEIIANNIAIPVNIPKYIVGMKLDKYRIENVSKISEMSGKLFNAARIYKN